MTLQRVPWAVLSCPICNNDAVVGVRRFDFSGVHDVPFVAYCAKPGCENGYLGRYLEVWKEAWPNREKLKLERLAGPEGYNFQIVGDDEDPFT